MQYFTLPTFAAQVTAAVICEREQSLLQCYPRVRLASRERKRHGGASYLPFVQRQNELKYA